MYLKKPMKIFLIISIGLLVVSITVFAASFGRSILGCFVSLFMMPISCCILVIGSLLVNNFVKGEVLPTSDVSTKRLSDVAEERQEGMVFCPSCGKQISVEYKLCPKCGYNL